MEDSTNDALLPAKDVLGTPVAAFVVYDEDNSDAPEGGAFPLEMNPAEGSSDVLSNVGQHFSLYSNPNQEALMTSVQHDDLNANNVGYHKVNHPAHQLHFINNSSVPYNNCANVPGMLSHPTLPESVQVLTAGAHRESNNGLDFQYPSYLPTVTLNPSACRPDLPSQYRVYGDVPQASQPVGRTFYVSNQATNSALVNAGALVSSRMETAVPKQFLVQPKMEVCETLPCSVKPVAEGFDNLSNTRVCRKKSIQFESSALAKERADLEELKKQLLLKEQALNEKEERLNIVHGKGALSGNYHWSGVPNKHRLTRVEMQSYDSCSRVGDVDHSLDRQSIACSVPVVAASYESSRVQNQGIVCRNSSCEDMNENLEVNPRLISKTYKRKPKRLDKDPNVASGPPVSTNVHGHQIAKKNFSETLSNGASSITIMPIFGHSEPLETSAHQFKALPNGWVKVEKLQYNTSNDNLMCPSKQSHQCSACDQTMLPLKRTLESSPGLRVQKKQTHKCSGIEKSLLLPETGSGYANHSYINSADRNLTTSGFRMGVKCPSEVQESWDRLSPVASFIIASPEPSPHHSDGDVNALPYVQDSCEFRESSVNCEAPAHSPSIVNHPSGIIRPTVLALSEQNDGRTLLPEHRNVNYVNSIPVHDDVRYIKTLPQHDVRLLKTSLDVQQDDVRYMETIPQFSHMRYYTDTTQPSDLRYILPSDLNNIPRSFEDGMTVVQEAPVKSDITSSLLNSSCQPCVGTSLLAQQNCIVSPPATADRDLPGLNSPPPLTDNSVNLTNATAQCLSEATTALEDCVSPIVDACNENNDNGLMMHNEDSSAQDAVKEKYRHVDDLEETSNVSLETVFRSSKVTQQSSMSWAAHSPPSENCNNDLSNSPVTVSSPSHQHELSSSRFSKDPPSCPSSPQTLLSEDRSPSAAFSNDSEIFTKRSPLDLASSCISAASKHSPMHERIASPIALQNSPGSPDDSYFHESEVLNSEFYSKDDDDECCNERTPLISFTEHAPEETHVSSNMTVVSSSNNMISVDSCNDPLTDQCPSTCENNYQTDQMDPTNVDSPVKSSDQLNTHLDSQIGPKLSPKAVKEQSCILSDNNNEFSEFEGDSVSQEPRCSYDDADDDDPLMPPRKKRLLGRKQDGFSKKSDPTSGADLNGNSDISEDLAVPLKPPKRKKLKTSHKKRKPRRAKKINKWRKRVSTRKHPSEEKDEDSPTSYECGVCCDGIVYESRRNFQYHVLSVHNGHARATGQSQDFTEAEKKQAHKQVLAEGLKLVCELCKSSFASLLGYEGHMQWCGKSALTRTHLCPKCGRSGTIFTIKIHLRNCTGFKKCDTTEDANFRPSRSSKVKCKAVFEQQGTENSDDQDSDAATSDYSNKADSSKNNYYFLVLCKQIKKPISEEQLRRWRADVKKNSDLVCCFESCGETLVSVEKMSEHVSNCSFRPLTEFLFACTLCHSTEEGLSIEDIVAHLLKNHPDDLKQVSMSYKRDRSRKLLSRKSGSDRYRILSSILDFREANHCTNLFQNWRVRMSEWTAPSNPTHYYSKCSISPKFIIDDIKNNADWQSLDLFRAIIYESSSYLFCGGCITASAWCTTPCESNQKQTLDQILAIGVSSETSDIVISSQQNSSGTIQIWNFGALGSLDSNNTVSPALALHIAHKYGYVTDLQWCPSGAFDPIDSGDRLGVLAAACSSGDIHLWFVPHLQQLPKTKHHTFLKLPDLTLSQVSFGDDDEVDIIPLRLDWLPSKGHGLMAASMSNGSIYVWNLQESNITTNAINTRILYPCRNLNAHLGPSSAVAWCPNSDGAVLATGGEDHMHHLWDLQGFTEPARLSTARRDIVTDTKWPVNTSVTALSFENSVNDGSTAAFRECGFFGNTLSYCKSRSPTWRLSFSDILGAILQGTQIGECLVTFPKNVYKIANEKLFRQHILRFTASIKDCRPSTSKKNKELGVVFQHTPELLEQKYVKPVDPLSLKAGSTPEEERAVAGEWNIKGSSSLVSITSVAFNPNMGAHDWLFCGYKSGLARVLRLPPHLC